MGRRSLFVALLLAAPTAVSSAALTECEKVSAEYGMLEFTGITADCSLSRVAWCKDAPVSPLLPGEMMSEQLHVPSIEHR